MISYIQYNPTKTQDVGYYVDQIARTYRNHYLCALCHHPVPITRTSTDHLLPWVYPSVDYRPDFVDRYCTAVGTGVYTFRVHGAMYHCLDHLLPGSKGPRHLQLYFYDTAEDDTLSHRVKRSPDLDINIIRNVLRILQANNPYVQTFNRVGSIPNLGDYVIELNTNVTPDQ